MDDMTAEMTADAFLDVYQKDTRQNLMPVIVVMAIICFLGIVGNSFTVAFYGFVARRTPTIFLITVLACVDLVVCVLIIAQVTEMAVNVKYTSAAACKILHFLGHWTIEISIILLMFIAIDRYRHVCCPFKRQFTYTVAKRVAVGIIIFSCLQSLRDFANFDIVEFPLEGYASNTTIALAHYCTTSNDPNYKLNITFWLSFDVVIVLTILVTLVVTYSRIVWVLKTGTSALDTPNKGKRCDQYAVTNDDKRSDVDTIKTSTHDDESCVDELSEKPGQGSGGNGPKKTSQIDSSKIKTPERSITLMMLVVSIAFCVCIIPYFVLKIGIRSYTSVSQLELGVGIQLAIRFTYVNSFVNPVVFCCFNPQFRRFIKGSMLKLKPGTRPSSTTASTGMQSSATA